MRHHLAILVCLALCLLAVASCKRSGAPNLERERDPNFSRTVEFPDALRGTWKLFVYAGKDDSMFEQGNGELLLITRNSCRVHFADDPLVPLKCGVNAVEEWYRTDSKRLVCWKRSEDNLFFTVIDTATNQVDWRGSYLRENYYEELRQTEQLSMGQLVNLSACKEYWYDLYDEAGSPRSRAEPVRIESKGYMIEDSSN